MASFVFTRFAGSSCSNDFNKSKNAMLSHCVSFSNVSFLPFFFFLFLDFVGPTEHGVESSFNSIDQCFFVFVH